MVTRDPAFAPRARGWRGSLARGARARGPARDEVFVVGGAEIYGEALPLADRIYLTRVHAAFEGDTVFPAFDASGWRVVVEERHEADEKNPYAHTFLVYERKVASSRPNSPTWVHPLFPSFRIQADRAPGMAFGRGVGGRVRLFRCAAPRHRKP